MSNIVEKLINLREILLKNGQKEAAFKVESVMKNIEDKEEVRSFELSLNIRDFGDLYLPIYDGDWWSILSETRKEVQELYFILESCEQELERHYIDMVNELFNIVKENKDEKLLIRLDKIVNDYNSPEMIKDLIKICVSQGGRPVKYSSTKYGNWGSLLGELNYKANAYLKKIENDNNYDKIEQYINEIKEQINEYFSIEKSKNGLARN